MTNKLLLTAITVLLTMIASAVGYITVKVLDVDRTVVAMKQHLVDQGWRPVALAPGSVPPVCSPGVLPQDAMRPVRNPMAVK
ncbi:MAG: hypothetical protein WC749_02035 [Dehalococcoidia bacterium]